MRWSGEMRWDRKSAFSPNPVNKGMIRGGGWSEK